MGGTSSSVCINLAFNTLHPSRGPSRQLALLTTGRRQALLAVGVTTPPCGGREVKGFGGQMEPVTHQVHSLETSITIQLDAQEWRVSLLKVT